MTVSEVAAGSLEHHLLPTMPSINLRRLRPIVIDFCRRHEPALRRDVSDCFVPRGVPIPRRDRRTVFTADGGEIRSITERITVNNSRSEKRRSLR